MGKITDPTDIRYLAFEGGGGKGVTYLGAIKALEDQGVLPIDIATPRENQIYGISGASAGAITALFLAMGCGYEELKKILENQSTFLNFFDGPLVGRSRLIAADNTQKVHMQRLPSNTLETQSRQQQQTPLILAAVKSIVSHYLSVSETHPIIKRLSSNTEGYLCNLLFDRGLFPGFAVRDFLSRAINEKLGRMHANDQAYPICPPSPSSSTPCYGKEIGFQRFYELTGVDLIITGSNVTRHKPGVFSRRHTPFFPVAEAVGISMSIPILFKPVHVEADVPINHHNKHTMDYHGMWVDGGMLNNFPLHAFDFMSPKLSDQHPNLKPLNPQMLGLRLIDGPSSKPTVQPNTFSLLQEYIGNLMGTMLYPSEDGQIRSHEEKQQTINLQTNNLSTFDFAPSATDTAKPIAEAEKSVNAYFT